jgi:hypothetical protein
MASSGRRTLVRIVVSFPTTCSLPVVVAYGECSRACCKMLAQWKLFHEPTKVFMCSVVHTLLLAPLTHVSLLLLLLLLLLVVLLLLHPFVFLVKLAFFSPFALFLFSFCSFAIGGELLLLLLLVPLPPFDLPCLACCIVVLLRLLLGVCALCVRSFTLALVTSVVLVGLGTCTALVSVCLEILLAA